MHNWDSVFNTCPWGCADTPSLTDGTVPIIEEETESQIPIQEEQVMIPEDFGAGNMPAALSWLLCGDGQFGHDCSERFVSRVRFWFFSLTCHMHPLQSMGWTYLVLSLLLLLLFFVQETVIWLMNGLNDCRVQGSKLHFVCCPLRIKKKNLKQEWLLAY